MIEQYLSNTNESATVLILQKKLELNKALQRCPARRQGFAEVYLGGSFVLESFLDNG